MNRYAVVIQRKPDALDTVGYYQDITDACNKARQIKRYATHNLPVLLVEVDQEGTPLVVLLNSTTHDF